MNIHLVDGTYELFRCYFGAPPSTNGQGQEIGATRTLVRSILSWLRAGQVTHVAFAFDHVIESFRNKLFDGYKTGDGIDPGLFSQFPLAETAMAALGVVVWPMVEFEADDALATGAFRFRDDPRVGQVFLCSPDKDLAQCVQGSKVLMWDRHRNILLDETNVLKRYGVWPQSIPDLLALVGDTADGIPGVPRWGAKSAAAVLRHYQSLENIPESAASWDVGVRGSAALADNLKEHRSKAHLYKKLATLRFDVPLQERVEDLEWRGAHRGEMEKLCAVLADREIMERVPKWSPNS